MDKRAVEITGLIDSAKYFGLPLGITTLTIFIMLVDGFDLQTMAFVAPELVKDWGINRISLGWFFTGGMIGMAVGSTALGRLGDVIGRKGAYIVCIAFLFVGSLGSAYSTGVVDLTLWRFVTGIGLGGVTPLATTLIAEWSPKHARPVAVACAIVAVPLGGSLGAAVSQWAIPAFGWRSIFFIGAGLPLLFFVIAWFLLPESPKYLAQHGRRHPQLARLLNLLLREKRFDGSESFMIDEPPRPAGNWFLSLLKRPYLGTTLLLWMAFLFNTLALYTFVNWLPTVLSSTGMNTESALQGPKFWNLGGFFGAVGGSALIVLVGSRLIGTGLSSMGAVAAILIGVTLVAAGGAAPSGQVLVLLMLAGVAMHGMQTFVYSVGAHSYPTYLRASGLGTAQTVSRIGGVISSWVGSAYFALEPRPPVSYFFYAVALVLVVVAISFFSLRTHIPGRRAAEIKAPAIENRPSS